MFHVPWFLFGKIGKAKESGVMSAEGADSEMASSYQLL